MIKRNAFCGLRIWPTAKTLGGTACDFASSTLRQQGSPPAEIVEIGRADVVIDDGRATIERPMARVYRPLNGIPPETMAIHHITENDFDPDTPACTDERLNLAVWGGTTPDILVAHNCALERLFVPGKITKSLPWICTFKVALRAWQNRQKQQNAASSGSRAPKDAPRCRGYLFSAPKPAAEARRLLGARLETATAVA
jgi:DNA polymerase III epsilon subunit-like protein